MAKLIVKSPLKFVEGTGVTISPSNELIFLRDVKNVTLSIPQAVESSSNVVFSQISSSAQLDLGVQSLNASHSSGTLFAQSTSLTGSLDIEYNVSTSGDFTVGGSITAQNILSELTQSFALHDSGSTQFGNSLDDTQNITGSTSITGSLVVAGYSITEISNDSVLADESTVGVVTEYATKQFFAPLFVNSAYLRKSFAHTGSLLNTNTASFTAITASAPDGFTTTNEGDFIFFLNGMLMEQDALTVQQSGSNFLSKIDTSALGYNLQSGDEIVAFGKFNS